MSNCVSCGAYLAEGEGMLCPLCEENNTSAKPREKYAAVVRSGGRALGKQEEAIGAALDRCAELETLLFAFVWNRAVYPFGLQLGKTEAEIADKTLETMEAAADMVDMSKMRRLLLSAKRRRDKKKSEVNTDESNGK